MDEKRDIDNGEVLVEKARIFNIFKRSPSGRLIPMRVKGRIFPHSLIITEIIRDPDGE